MASAGPKRRRERQRLERAGANLDILAFEKGGNWGEEEIDKQKKNFLYSIRRPPSSSRSFLRSTVRPRIENVRPQLSKVGEELKWAKRGFGVEVDAQEEEESDNFERRLRGGCGLEVLGLSLSLSLRESERNLSAKLFVKEGESR